MQGVSERTFCCHALQSRFAVMLRSNGKTYYMLHITNYMKTHENKHNQVPMLNYYSLYYGLVPINDKDTWTGGCRFTTVFFSFLSLFFLFSNYHVTIGFFLFFLFFSPYPLLYPWLLHSKLPKSFLVIFPHIPPPPRSYKL